MAIDPIHHLTGKIMSPHQRISTRQHLGYSPRAKQEEGGYTHGPLSYKIVTRRSLLFGLPAAGVSAYGYARLVEPSWLDVTEQRIPAKLPQPIRILHLSDMHASGIIPMSFIEESFRLGLATRPDIICLTGDYVTTTDDFDADLYEKTLKLLTSAAPTYAVMGNHDGGLWAAASGWFGNHHYIAQMLTKSGVTVLHNTAALLKVKGSAIKLAGVGDWWSEEVDAQSAFTAIPGQADSTIVLNHNPDAKSDCAPYAWDLMLCGHTHGGQLRIPFYGAAYAPVLDRRYEQGLNRFENRWIFTTRGVGNVRGVRFNCRPEVSTLVLG
jgi:predicted MPP superfamily phosphohydrolase